MSDTLARTAKAIHTLFYADEAASERRTALRASVTTDAELEAYQALDIALIGFEPPSPEDLEQLRKVAADVERRDAERPKKPSERISIDANTSPEGQYAKRLLEKMYTVWQGTLDYERGMHRFVFYSPFDEGLRRHTSFVAVAIDGESSEVHARSYILGPYLRVQDERTGRKSDEPWKVLNGDLTPILPIEEASA